MKEEIITVKISTKVKKTKIAKISKTFETLKQMNKKGKSFSNKHR